MKEFFIPCKKNKYKPYLLGKTAIVIYSIFLILVNSFGSFLGIPQTYASEITQTNIIYLANQSRSSGGLKTLSANTQLAAAALAKANNMFELQYWDHYGPNGETPWQFIRAAGYDYVYAGENLAKGFQTAEGVHEAWMASESHRANIMSSYYEDIGVAVVTGVLEGSQTILVVQMFGSRNVSTPVVTDDTEEETEEENSNTEEETYVPTESGEIMAISIKSPKTGDLLNDPSVNIKGEVENVDDEYTVKISDNGKDVGTTDTTSSDSWEFDKNSDWSEGEHKVKASISGTKISSDEVTFTIDSNPPEIDESSIKVVHNEDSYTITFSVNEEVSDAILVTGDKSFELEKDEDGNMTLEINKNVLGESTQLIVSDELGNSAAIDVSEYFMDDSESEDVNVSFAGFVRSMSVSDRINVVVAFVVFVLLCLEIYIYWKKNKFKNIANDLFALGFWWLILVVGATTGFVGFIN